MCLLVARRSAAFCEVTVGVDVASVVSVGVASVVELSAAAGAALSAAAAAGGRVEAVVVAGVASVVLDDGMSESVAGVTACVARDAIDVVRVFVLYVFYPVTTYIFILCGRFTEFLELTK